MSSDEQMASIGRLVTERSEANKQISLLRNEIKLRQVKLNELALHLEHSGDSARVAKSVSVLDGLIGVGGLEELRKLVAEFQSLTTRVSEIGVTLRNAGVE